MAKDAHDLSNLIHDTLKSSAVAPRKTDGRFSTFDTWPQYIFPSRWNNLPSGLETPYAFSHHLGCFFWTRDDALNDVRWNLHAKPPCLNCVVKGEVRAKNCDRMIRQEESYGLTTCCTPCEKDGTEESCIETIEKRIRPLGTALIDAERRLRVEPQNGHGTGRVYDQGYDRRVKTFIDEVLWNEHEKDLRRRGSVIWKPINLHVGSIGAKVGIVERFERGEGRETSHSEFTENSNRFLQTIKGIDLHYDIRNNMRRTVVEWDLASETQSQRTTSEAGPPPQNTRRTPVSSNIAENPASEVEIALGVVGLDDVCEHWSHKLHRSQAELYTVEVKGLGRRNADRTAERFRQDFEEISPQVQTFLSNTMKVIVEDEMGVKEANEAALATLTEKAKYWFQRLIPEMITT